MVKNFQQTRRQKTGTMIKNTKIKEKISHPNMFIGGNNLYQSRNKSVDGVVLSPKDN